MSSWEDFERAEPDLAAFGRARLDDKISYLATIRTDGGPRVHPVSPWVAAGRLWLRMYPSSIKTTDLNRDPRFALHATVADDTGGEGELAIRGTAVLVVDQDSLATANRGKADPERYCVFELGLETIMATTYDGDQTTRRRWVASPSSPPATAD